MKRKSDGDNLMIRADTSRRASSKRRAMSLGLEERRCSRTASPDLSEESPPPRPSIEASTQAQEALDLLDKADEVLSNASDALETSSKEL